jgi:polysaccharide chain length determinant protein (PEP-CTERM system associated)
MDEVIQQVLTIARRMWKFRWPALAAAWVATVVGTVAVWRIPDQFEASARVFVDTDSILKPLMSGLAVQPNVDQQIGMLSRTLMSRPNLETLVRKADLDLKTQSKAEQEQLIERLQRGIEIRTAGGVNLYSMSYRDTDAEKAKRVIQVMVSIFVESGLGATRKDTDSAKSFLNEQIKIVETKLEEAETRLKEFRLRNIDRQVADGKDSTQRLAEISAMLETARLQLREAERSRDAAKRQLAESRAVATGSAVPSVLAESAMVAVATPEIDARIEAQKRNLDGLLQRYTEQHPDVIGARRLITELEQQKRKEVQELQKRAMAAAAVTPTAAAGNESLAQQELNRMMATAEVQVAAMQARVDEYSKRYAVARDQLKTAPQIEAEAAQLNRDYTVMRRNYDELVTRRQAAMMSGELDIASGVTEFKLIDPPRVAPQPVAPNRMLLFSAVCVGSMVLGLVAAFAAAQLRPTFGDGNELRQATGLPLLGSVTLLLTDDDRRRERNGMLRFAGASGGLVIVLFAGMLVMLLINRRGA